MLDRRYILRLFCLATAAFAGRRVVSAQTQEPTLREQLENGLKARLPEEFEFIDTVVTLVDNGTLSRTLVDKIFFYVRRKKGNKKYLVPYFELLLRQKAREEGVEIP